MRILPTQWFEHEIMQLDVAVNSDQVQMIDILCVEN